MARGGASAESGEARRVAQIPAVHFGPGRLGLGLIADVLLETGRYDVYVIGRPDSEHREERCFRVRFVNPEIGERERLVTWAGNPRGVDELPDVLVEHLTGDGPVLFTAALGDEHVGEARERISALLALRPGSAPTAMLACENEPHDIYDQIAKLNPHVRMSRCVVDRICAWETPKADELGKRILAHDVSEWVIPHAGPSGDSAGGALSRAPRSAERLWPPLEGLRGADHVVLLEGGEIAHKRRKLWLVNGIHMVLATIARSEGVDALPLVGELRDEFSTRIKPLMMTMLETVDRAYSLPIDEQFADERVRAFCEMPDSAHRVLARRYLRADLRPFVQRLHTRLGEAARMAHDQGLDVEPFVWAYTAVADAIGVSDSFLDVNEVDGETGALKLCTRPPAVSAEIDAEVVAMFDASLSGWAPLADRADLVRRVRSALVTWRPS